MLSDPFLTESPPPNKEEEHSPMGENWNLVNPTQQRIYDSTHQGIIDPTHQGIFTQNTNVIINPTNLGIFNHTIQGTISSTHKMVITKSTNQGIINPFNKKIINLPIQE